MHWQKRFIFWWFFTFLILKPIMPVKCLNVNTSCLFRENDCMMSNDRKHVILPIVCEQFWCFMAFFIFYMLLFLPNIMYLISDALEGAVDQHMKIFFTRDSYRLSIMASIFYKHPNEKWKWVSYIFFSLLGYC